jgi:Protein of unknown function (DUF2931)
MKKYITLVLFITLLQTSCKDKTMKEETSFIYNIAVGAPEEYPVEVNEGVLSNRNTFISAIPKSGIAASGWGFGSSSAGMKGGIIPNHLELTWISYAEKKFWKIDCALPEYKILALFQKGNVYYDNNDVKQKGTYKELIIGLAPGGVVVLWLDGSASKVEIGRFQAKEIYVNKLDFQPVKIEDETQEQYFERRFKVCVSKEIQEQIKKEGIPFGLWDEYRTKYNWRFHTLSYKQNAEELVTEQITDFLNGEFTKNSNEQMQITKEFTPKPVPWRTGFTYKDNNSDAEFDKVEIMQAFKTLSKKHPNEPIEIQIKTTFLYKGLTFKVICAGDEIVLEKTKVEMYVN